MLILPRHPPALSVLAVFVPSVGDGVVQGANAAEVNTVSVLGVPFSLQRRGLLLSAKDYKYILCLTAPLHSSGAV